jgi:hypothetical protein
MSLTNDSGYSHILFKGRSVSEKSCFLLRRWNHAAEGLWIWQMRNEELQRTKWEAHSFYAIEWAFLRSIKCAFWGYALLLLLNILQTFRPRSPSPCVYINRRSWAAEAVRVLVELRCPLVRTFWPAFTPRSNTILLTIQTSRVIHTSCMKGSVDERAQLWTHR